MQIGELARTTATKVETIRFYEKIGLLPEPGRTSGNYRDYGAAHLARLSFIRRTRCASCSLCPTIVVGRVAQSTRLPGPTLRRSTKRSPIFVRYAGSSTN
jgi:hypothetical protein